MLACYTERIRADSDHFKTVLLVLICSPYALVLQAPFCNIHTSSESALYMQLIIPFAPAAPAGKHSPGPAFQIPNAEWGIKVKRSSSNQIPNASHSITSQNMHNRMPPNNNKQRSFIRPLLAMLDHCPLLCGPSDVSGGWRRRRSVCHSHQHRMRML